MQPHDWHDAGQPPSAPSCARPAPPAADDRLQPRPGRCPSCCATAPGSCGWTAAASPARPHPRRPAAERAGPLPPVLTA
jgi:hypothetical protein